MADPTKYRDRKFVAVLYPDDPTHAACMDKLKTGGYNFAAILHDKDVYEDGDHKGEIKKAHWHIVLRFKNAVWNTALAKELGIEPRHLEECRNVDGALCYLVHYGNDDKFQYDFENVFGPLRVRLATLLADTDEGTRALQIVDIVENSPGCIGYTELIKKAVAAGIYADLRRMGTFAVHIVNEHNDEVRRELGYASQLDADRERFAYYMKTHGDVPFSTLINALDRQKMLGKVEPLEP